MHDDDRTRIEALRKRWEEYDRAFRGDRTVPFDARREDVVAAYTDWVDAVEGAVHRPAFEARQGAKALARIGIKSI